MCRLEKYFANISITTSFIGSTGCREKAPRSNQPFAPLNTLPTANRRKSSDTEIPNNTTTTLVFFKKLQFIVLANKKTKVDIESQIICLSKNKLFPVKEFILTRPAIDITKTEEKSTQSTSLNKPKNTLFTEDKNILFDLSINHIYDIWLFRANILSYFPIHTTQCFLIGSKEIRRISRTKIFQKILVYIFSKTYCKY